jgi:hypothetical protein
MKRKILGVLALAVIGLSLVGCPQPNTGNSNESLIDGIDYTSYPASSGLITVKNESQTNMVLFKGAPSSNNILGGVKAGSTVTLKKNDSFNKSVDFVVYAVSADDYNAHKTSLAALDSNPYTTFYAVYNDNAKSTDYVYKISKLLAGSNKIIINNPTDYNVELRNMGLNGETLCFSMAMTFEKKYNADFAAAANDGIVMLFPVFRKYDSAQGEIFDVYPRYQSGQAAGKVKFERFGFDEENKEFKFNANKWIQGVKFTPSAAYIQITNGADMGLSFYKGANSVEETTSSGGKVINTSKKLLFPIAMTPTDEKATTFEESTIISGYRLGNGYIDDIYLLGDATTTLEVKGGYVYSFTVTGGMEEGYTVVPLEEDVGKNVEELVSEKYVDEDGTEHPAVYKTVTLTEKVIKATPYKW